MKQLSFLTVAFFAFHFIAPAPAATIYSSLQDVAIPLNFDGVYVDVDGGSTNTTEFTGWDINPFFGGTGVASSPAFLPARIGAGNTATILRFAVGDTVDVSRIYSTGYGGSQTHIGTQFSNGQAGYLGFKFTNNAGAGPYYGWMRVVFTGNTAGAVIKDWAYDNGGSAIVTGRVLQSAPSAGAQLVTLSPGTGESFTLGSALTNTGGNINSLLKTGAGTAILAMANTYTGGTTLSSGVLNVSADSALGAAIGGVTISGNAVLQAGGAIASNRTFTLGAGGGTIDTNGSSVTLGATSTVAGSSLTKIGAGTLTINGAQTYTALNANAGTTILNTPLGSGGATVSVGANVVFGATQTLAALTIGAAGVVSLNAAPPPAPSDSLAGTEELVSDFDQNGTPLADQISAPLSGIDGNEPSFSQNGIGADDFGVSPPPTIPEPHAMGLLLFGALGFLRRGPSRRRRIA